MRQSTPYGSTVLEVKGKAVVFVWYNGHFSTLKNIGLINLCIVIK